jgi:hypothetical protein
MPSTPQRQQQLSSTSCSTCTDRVTLQLSRDAIHGHTRMLHDRHAMR